ncbi:MAG TPA: EAL domain-containing response regulator [Steroidobacteraceae bacterium]|nr:EAL domain-containing response regulator [Steroidobacteraceae bacterium]
MRMNNDDVRIAVVDDDPLMLKLLGYQLARLGYTQVIACDSGIRALQRIATSNFSVDLILLDINMPGMDGVEFIRRLVDYRYGGGVILVSGENSRILESVERLIAAHQLEALGHLTKPVQLPALKALLGKLKPRNELPLAVAADQSCSADQLRFAIANGQLVNHYQPKVVMQTREVIGVEALVRWQHPVNGLIAPALFIPLAAEYGLMRDLTRAVLSAAMQDARSWMLLGHRLSMAVNISMDDLGALDFPDTAASLAHSAGIDPRQVILEVTEDQMMERLSVVLDVLSRLQLKRFRLAIDDFGTGHSSLAHLRDLPFDELKVDRGFVHGAANDATLRAICSASLRMAQQLRMQVVAEGIEDQSDWDLLGSMGCDVGQGYFIARPMPAAALPAWLHQWELQQERGLEREA